jgi:hypothetical protein
MCFSGDRFASPLWFRTENRTPQHRSGVCYSSQDTKMSTHWFLNPNRTRQIVRKEEEGYGYCNRSGVT